MSQEREISLSFGTFILFVILAANSCSVAHDADRIADAVEKMAPKTTTGE